jgi:hypothetical protein
VRLVDLSLLEVIEFFPCREAAERSLEEVLDDEPDWACLLDVEAVEIGPPFSAN